MNFEKEDRIISDFILSLGPWNKFIIVGGGYALIIYKLYLTDPKLQNPPVGTRDIDSLIPRKVPKISEKSISKHLQDAGFSLIFKDLDQPATEAYTKEIDEVEIEIEFLTDSASRSNKYKNVLIAGIVAQPLSYLTLSLETTVKFQTHKGNAGSVVSSGAWIFHKGLTFTKRKSTSKTYKDLYGIWYVATQLGDFSEKAIAELLYLGSQHPKWFKTFRDNLHNWIENASPLDWTNLEIQDPSGKLKKQNFEKIIHRL